MTLSNSPQNQVDCPDKKLRFVQLPHPIWEHKPDDPNGKRRWHKFKLGHRRQLMRLKRAQWIDEEGNKHTGYLYAWVEWEAESIIVPDFNPPDHHPLAPKHLWDPYWVPKKDYSGLHNTDPFIFGGHFLYSNCKQIRKGNKTGMQSLAPGSLIMFGSCTTKEDSECKENDEKEFKWILDTVLVVLDSSRFNPQNLLANPENKMSDTFLNVTIAPLSEAPDVKDSAVQFRLYRGATPEKPFNGIFSFFPAKPVGGDSAFRRPVIKFPGKYSKYCNPKSRQSPKGLSREVTDREILELWELIVKQVYDAGLVLGTHADLPPKRPEEP